MKSLNRFLPVTALAFVLTNTPVLAEPSIEGELSEVLDFARAQQGAPLVLDADGEARSQADKLDIVAEVTTKDGDLKDAIAENRAIRERIRGALMARGVADSAIKFDRFSSSPDYGRFTGKVRSYTITNRVTISAKSETEVEAVAGLVDEIEEFDLISMSQDLVDIGALQRRALQDAGNNLLKNKQALEQVLGVKLKLVSVHVGGASQPARGGLRKYASQPEYSRSKMPLVSSMAGAVAEAPAPAGLVGEIIVHASISGTFIIVAE